MLDELTSETLTLAVIGGLGLVVVVVLTVVAAMSVAWLSRSGGRPRGDDRTEMLADLGYISLGDHEWRMQLTRSELVFDDEADDGGWQWSVRLPRYNTLTLRVQERSEATQIPPGTFETRNPVLDERFVMSSRLPAQTIALLMDPKVGHTMLAMPYLRLVLSGDELVITDPELRGLRHMVGGARAGSAASLEAEAEYHRIVATVATAILATLYSKITGTLLPEHR